MIAYQVNDMTCGHCVSMITKAVKWVDPAAKVAIDLASKRVEIGSANATSSELKEAIEDAGYTAVEAAHVIVSACQGRWVLRLPLSPMSIHRSR